MDGSTPGEADEGSGTPAVAVVEGVGETDQDETTAMRTNQHIVDDSSVQRMTMDEIEALKQSTTGAGKEIIARLLESHTALDQKTEFSRAKYMLKKRRKFLKRFTVLPVDPALLVSWMLDKGDTGRTMELRDESLGLIGCWGNVHYCEEVESRPSGRWLVVDDTGGLLAATLAERMGILYPSSDGDDDQDCDDVVGGGDDAAAPAPGGTADSSTNRRERIPPMSSTHSTLTVIHNHTQPNLSFLQYFSFDTADPDESHPLHTHLKTLSWMQLLDPESDSLYSTEPPAVPAATLAEWKPARRGIYYKKRRRYERVRRVADETRAGGFDGLIVASALDPASILRHTVPLLAGSAPVVVYSPHVEPLVRLADLYSTARRTAYVQRRRRETEEEEDDKNGEENGNGGGEQVVGDDDNNNDDDEDFPVDPTLLLGSTLQTSRVRQWQVLPGRTHPLMTSRGGAEGYVFHAIRAMPAEGKVQARGQPGRKRRKVGGG